MDYNRMVNNHMRNIRIASGVYEYTNTTEELYNAMIRTRADLNYSLRKEVKRDRYVANKRGLEESIIKAVNQVLEKELDNFGTLVAEDVSNKVYSTIGGATGGMKSSFSMDIGKTIGRALGQAPFKILDEIMKDED